MNCRLNRIRSAALVRLSRSTRHKKCPSAMPRAVPNRIATKWLTTWTWTRRQLQPWRPKAGTILWAQSAPCLRRQSHPRSCPSDRMKSLSCALHAKEPASNWCQCRLAPAAAAKADRWPWGARATLSSVCMGLAAYSPTTIQCDKKKVHWKKLTIWPIKSN